MTSLESLRAEISEIDDQIFELVAKRIELAKRIGAEKKSLNLPIVAENVATVVLTRNREKCNQLGLEQQLADDLTKLLIDYSVKVQSSR